MSNSSKAPIPSAPAKNPRLTIEMLSVETEKWAKVIRAANIKAE
jgi:hypothetical protein